MSNSFKQYADAGLQHIHMSEAVKDRVRQRIRAARPKAAGRPVRLSLRMALTIALVAATMTAFALTRGFGLFDLMGTVMPHFATVRLEAEQLVHRNLASYSFEHVDVAIREAAYDGRYLRVAYAVTDRAATAPLDTPGASLTSDRPEMYAFTAAEQDGIWWSTLDWALVDGQDVNPLGMSFSIAGPGNGEAITWVQFDVRGLTLPDTFTVQLPLRGRDTPQALAFTMSKGNMAGVYALVLPDDKRMGDYVVRVHEAIISPIRTYITLHLVLDPGATVAQAWDVATRWAHDATLANADGSDPQPWTDTGLGPVSNMEWTHIQQADGSEGWEDRIVDPGKPVIMAVYGEFTPHMTYPHAFRLGYSDQDFILIPLTRQGTP